MTADRDALRERYRVSNENQLSERARLEQRVEDLSTQLSTQQQGSKQVTTTLSEVKRAFEVCETRGEELARQGEMWRRECEEARSSANQLRLIADQAEHMVDECKRRMLTKDTHLDELTRKVSHYDIPRITSHLLS